MPLLSKTLGGLIPKPVVGSYNLRALRDGVFQIYVRRGREERGSGGEGGKAARRKEELHPGKPGLEFKPLPLPIKHYHEVWVGGRVSLTGPRIRTPSPWPQLASLFLAEH